MWYDSLMTAIVLLRVFRTASADAVRTGQVFVEITANRLGVSVDSDCLLLWSLDDKGKQQGECPLAVFNRSEIIGYYLSGSGKVED